MNLVILLPLLLLAAAFAVAVMVTRRNRMHPAFWLVLLYVGSCVAALFVNVRLLGEMGIRAGQQDWAALGAYGISLVFFLAPSFALRNESSRRLSIPVLESVAKYSAPFVLFSVVYLAPFAWQGLMLGADVVRANLNVRGIGLLPENGLTTIATVTVQFYFLFALIFIVSTVTGARWWIRVVAFLGSTLYLLDSICFAARDGILWFLVAYLWAIWYAKPIMPKRAIIRIRRFVAPIAVAGTVAFGIFSVQRFGDRSDGNLSDYLLLYYGSQPYVFATTVDQQKEFYGGRLRFPLFVEPFGGDAKVDREAPYEWSFGTFVKDLYAAGGWTVVLLATACVPLLLILALYMTSGRFPETYALISMVYVQIMAQGVFYLRLGMRAGNLYVLCIAALAVAMLVLRGNVRRVAWR